MPFPRPLPPIPPIIIIGSIEPIIDPAIAPPLPNLDPRDCPAYIPPNDAAWNPIIPSIPLLGDACEICCPPTGIGVNPGVGVKPI